MLDGAQRRTALVWALCILSACGRRADTSIAPATPPAPIVVPPPSTYWSNTPPGGPRITFRAQESAIEEAKAAFCRRFGIADCRLIAVPHEEQRSLYSQGMRLDALLVGDCLSGEQGIEPHRSSAYLRVQHSEGNANASSELHSLMDLECESSRCRGHSVQTISRAEFQHTEAGDFVYLTATQEQTSCASLGANEGDERVRVLSKTVVCKIAADGECVIFQNEAYEGRFEARLTNAGLERRKTELSGYAFEVRGDAEALRLVSASGLLLRRNNLAQTSGSSRALLREGSYPWNALIAREDLRLGRASTAARPPVRR